MQSGLNSLILTARQQGIELSVDSLTHAFGLGEDETNENILVKMANANGLKARSASMKWKAISRLGSAFPIIARLNDGSYVVVTGYRPPIEDEDEYVLVINPMAPKPQAEKITKEAFLSKWSGRLVFIKRQYDLTDEDQPFSVSWLIGGFLRQKVLLVELLVISFILHAFAVLPAVFIMIVLDKVVNYQAFSTLYVIATGVVIAYLFNGLLGYLRQYIILFATSKVDVKLNALMFSKLLNLPLSFFHQKSAAAVAKTMQQTISLRQILTGKFFTAILDATSLLVFIPILFLYSPLLCGIVFIFAMLISTNVILASKFQKNRLSQASSADGRKQAVMMDSILGIETVKSLALEPIQTQEWEDAISAHTGANLELGKYNAISAQISSTLQQLMTVAVIFVGVQLVFAGELSAGVLIGVNMLAGRVTGPLVQLVTLSTDMEKVRAAIKGISSIMNSHGEKRRRGLATDIIGGIEFRNVNFAYADKPKSLDNVSLTIEPRQRVAIIGRMGGGKSTIARLIQGISRPDEGTVLIDGHDINLMDLGHLRYNVSAVSQDTRFFKGTIRYNLLKPFPSAPMARVVWAAKLVGLHADIEVMPEGYETNMDEGGTNLSSGILQKIAITRALIRNPRILILDEAITHFDVESELDLRAKMKDISSGRTVILITSHVSQAMDSDLILVVDKGKIVEHGKHQDLAAAGGLYSEFWDREKVLIGASTPSKPKRQAQVPS